MYRGDLPRNYFNMTTFKAAYLQQLEYYQKHGPWYQWSEDPDCCVQFGSSNESLQTFAKQICIDNCIENKVDKVESILYNILQLKRGDIFDREPLIDSIKSLPEPLSTKLLAMIPEPHYRKWD